MMTTRRGASSLIDVADLEHPGLLDVISRPDRTDTVGRSIISRMGAMHDEDGLASILSLDWLRQRSASRSPDCARSAICGLHSDERWIILDPRQLSDNLGSLSITLVRGAFGK